MPSAGELRDRIGFYRRGSGDSSPDYGNPEGEFESDPEFQVYARIKPKLGGEDILSARLSGRNFVNITVRKSSNTADVTTDWRAKNERTGEIFEIRSIIDPYAHQAQRGRWIELLCEAGLHPTAAEVVVATGGYRSVFLFWLGGGASAA